LKGPSEGPPGTRFLSRVINGARLLCYREIASRLSPRPTTDNNEAARDCAHSHARTLPERKREREEERERGKGRLLRGTFVHRAFSRRRRAFEGTKGAPIGILVKQSGHFAPGTRRGVPAPLPRSPPPLRPRDHHLSVRNRHAIVCSWVRAN